MVLRQIPPLSKKQYEFVVDKLKEEEENPSKARLKRIQQAQESAKKMGKVKYP